MLVPLKNIGSGVQSRCDESSNAYHYAQVVPPRITRAARRHFGAAGTSPYLDMTDTKAALSGGAPLLTTAATSLKYWAPMSGDRTINARAVSANGFEKA